MRQLRGASRDNPGMCRQAKRHVPTSTKVAAVTVHAPDSPKSPDSTSGPRLLRDATEARACSVTRTACPYRITAKLPNTGEFGSASSEVRVGACRSTPSSSASVPWSSRNSGPDDDHHLDVHLGPRQPVHPQGASDHGLARLPPRLTCTSTRPSVRTRPHVPFLVQPDV